MEAIAWIAAAYFATGLCFGLVMLRQVGWGVSFKANAEALLVAVVAWPAILIAAKRPESDG